MGGTVGGMDVRASCQHWASAEQPDASDTDTATLPQAMHATPRPSRCRQCKEAAYVDATLNAHSIHATSP